MNLVKWSQWNSNRMVAVGQMSLREIQKCLQDFEKQAHEVLVESEADHVLYGIKKYNDEGILNEVRFYLQPMTEAEFDRVARMKGVQVYAIHARR